MKILGKLGDVQQFTVPTKIHSKTYTLLCLTRWLGYYRRYLPLYFIVVLQKVSYNNYFTDCVCKAVHLSSTKSMRNLHETQKVEESDSTSYELHFNYFLSFFFRIATENYIAALRKKSKGFRQQVSEFDRKRVQTGILKCRCLFQKLFSSFNEHHCCL